MPSIVRTNLLVVLATSLAACGGAIAPAELATLDGRWAGDINRARSDQEHCKLWGLQMTIRGGAVTGEAFDLNAPVARFAFNSYVETDGQMFIDAHVGGELVRVSGRFSRNSFSGASRTASGCLGRVSLSRARSLNKIETKTTGTPA